MLVPHISEFERQKLLRGCREQHLPAASVVSGRSRSRQLGVDAQFGMERFRV